VKKELYCFIYLKTGNLNGSIEIFEARQMAEQMRNYRASCGCEVSVIAEMQSQTFDPQPTIQQSQQAAPPPNCRVCGGQLSYIERYQRWYCYQDRTYYPDLQPTTQRVEFPKTHGLFDGTPGL